MSQEQSSKFQIGVIVATCDRTELLSKRSIPSIMEQSQPPDFLIVVDDSRLEEKRTNKNIDKGNQIITSSPIVEDKFQSKINININPNVNMKNNLSSFNNRFEKKPAPVN